jgi:hypothetical protein
MRLPYAAIIAGSSPRRIDAMMKFLSVLVCLAFAGSAVAADRRPPKKAERQTQILRSLDRIELQIVKARQKIDRLEGEISRPQQCWWCLRVANEVSRGK